jgi:DNA repair exonuclease SbcCD nuclease subunit
MLSFIHTSDWHLGHVYRKLGARAGESAQWRLDAARRVFDLAIEKKADFVVVAGDVFDTDTPTPDVMQAAVAILRDAPVPTYLISGNHDPLAEGSVWFHPVFADALQGAANIHIACENETLQVNNGDGVLYACPVTARHSREDATRWIPDAPRSQNQARIGLAHGGWKGYWQSGEYSQSELNAIDNQTADRCGLDYLALGDYHSFTPEDHHARRARTYYSGTPEVSAHDDARAGHALWVQIEKPGANPIVTPCPTGRAQCHNWGEIVLQPGDGISLLQTKLDAIENRDVALVRAKISGTVSQSEWRDLNEWLGLLRETVLGADVDVSRLLTEPTREDFLALKLEAPEQHLLEMLHAPLDLQNLSGLSDREIIANWSRDEAARRAARTLFYQLLRGE